MLCRSRPSRRWSQHQLPPRTILRRSGLASALVRCSQVTAQQPLGGFLTLTATQSKSGVFPASILEFARVTEGLLSSYVHRTRTSGTMFRVAGV